MATFADLVERLGELLLEMDELEEPLRGRVLELLDGVDSLHRLALGRLADGLDDEMLERLRAKDPAVAWLLDAYSIGVDERAAADAALEAVRPFIHSHGGKVEVLGADRGVVKVRLSGSCSGCTASVVTLKEGIEQALADGFAGFRGLAVEEDDAAPHAPPGPTLLQIGPLDRG